MTERRNVRSQTCGSRQRSEETGLFSDEKQRDMSTGYIVKLQAPTIPLVEFFSCCVGPSHQTCETTCWVPSRASAQRLPGEVDKRGVKQFFGQNPPPLRQA